MYNENALPSINERPNGLHRHYIVRSRSGRDNPKAEYFPLRLDSNGDDPKHVEACKVAILAYAEAIKEHLPLLAKDIVERYGAKEEQATNGAYDGAIKPEQPYQFKVGETVLYDSKKVLITEIYGGLCTVQRKDELTCIFSVNVGHLTPIPEEQQRLKPIFKDVLYNGPLGKGVNDSGYNRVDQQPETNNGFYPGQQVYYKDKLCIIQRFWSGLIYIMLPEGQQYGVLESQLKPVPKTDTPEQPQQPYLSKPIVTLSPEQDIIYIDLSQMPNKVKEIRLR